MKSIQVAKDQVESISEEDIKNVLKNFSDNIYLKQNLILFICDKNDIESYKKEVIKRFISRMRRDYMMVYIFIILISIIILMLLPLFKAISTENEVGCTFTVRIFSLLVTVCLIYLYYFLWNNTFTSNIRQWWSAFFSINYILFYMLVVTFLVLLARCIIFINDNTLNEKLFVDLANYSLWIILVLVFPFFGSLIVFFYFIPNNCEHKDSDLQKVLSKLEETEKEEAKKLKKKKKKKKKKEAKRLEKEEKKRLEEKETENKEEN